MRSALRASLATLLAACFVLSAAGSAGAAVRGRIVFVEARQGVLHLVLSAAGLAEGQTIDAASLKVTLAGKAVDATVESPLTAAASPVVRRAVLAIDTSGSMNTNNRIGAARQAALAYLERVPADVEVGLVTFSSTAVVRVAPTRDRASIRTQLQRLVASGDTALFDAVSLSRRLLGSRGDRTILLLSDGKDEGSRTSLAGNVAALRTAKIPLDGVLLGETSAQSSLVALSEAAGGRVVSARAAADLTRTFEQAARSSDKDVALSVKIPAGFTGGEAAVTVTGTAGGQDISDTVLAVNLVTATAGAGATDSGPRAVSPLSGPFQHKSVLAFGLLALFLGVGSVLAFALNGVAARPQTMSGRLRPYVGRGGGQPPAERPANRGVRETALGIADDLVKNRGLEVTLGRRLEAGGVPLKPAEWLILHVGFAVLLPLFVLLITDVNPAMTATAIVVGSVGPLGYLALKARRRTNAFLAQLPDTLQLIAGSLSAGYSLPQAVDAVVRQGRPPISDELRKALIEARLGAPIEDALDDVADRMSSKDFRWVVMAVRVQRQVGGNLAEILSTTAATLRERERLRRQVQVLSAEGRLSAYILFGLPISFALYMAAVRPGYLGPLFTDPIGLVLVVGTVILLAIGGFWLRKVVTVEV